MDFKNKTIEEIATIIKDKMLEAGREEDFLMIQANDDAISTLVNGSFSKIVIAMSKIACTSEHPNSKSLKYLGLDLALNVLRNYPEEIPEFAKNIIEIGDELQMMMNKPIAQA